MSQIQQVYQWYKVIREQMPLGVWQAKGAALFSLGVVWSEHNWVSKVAEHLGRFGRIESMERRLQRWLDNERIDVQVNCGAWSRWVLKSLVDPKRIVLVVDLTKLSDRMDVMMVGLAYRKRCIPLVWRCMAGNQPWPQGQVDLIMELLQVIAPALPDDCTPLVQADRGISHSSQLLQRIEGMGWHYLVRVKGTTILRREGHLPQPLLSLIRGRHRWSGAGRVFEQAGGLSVQVHLIWRESMQTPWCLMTNAPHITGGFYAARMWQEESFRDLKSGGWQWHRSLIQRPDHAQRLLLALTLAYGWVLALGTRAICASKATRRRLTRGRRRTYSVFRLGLRYFRDLHSNDQPLPMSLFFRPNFNHF